MLSKTLKLKGKLESINSHSEKIELLREAYKDETCYILTAGPSINDHSKELLEEKLKDKLVIAVKQTYNLVPNCVDFHLLNQFNYQQTKYADETPIVMSVSLDKAKLKTPGLMADLNFLIDINKTTREDSLSGKMDFSNWTLDRGDNYRPFGPGIMHELAIFLPVLLGCKEVVVLGWDLGSPKTNEVTRYYEKPGTWKKLQKSIMDKYPNFYNKFIVRCINYYRYQMYRFDKSIVLNNPGITVDEAGFIAESTGPLYKWLIDQGVKLSVVSSSSMVDSLVPRKEL